MRKQEKFGIMRRNVTIEDADFYIRLAFSRARGAKGRTKKKKGGNRGNPRKKKEQGYFSLKREYADHIAFMSEFIEEQFSKIIGAFPEVHRQSEFYRELIEITISTAELKKSLAALSWCMKRISRLAGQCKMDVMKADRSEDAKKAVRGFEGRLSSMLRQVDSNLKFLKEAKMKIKNYPLIKRMYGVAIVGFPNVGKSTLLAKMTGARPEIAAYAFTTKSLMLGYFSAFEFPGAEKDVQVMDTPGTLSRPERMNDIEKQAYSAMKNAASIIVFILDPTGSYPLEEQEKLFLIIEKFGKPLYAYISKTDIENESVVCNSEKIRRIHPDAFESAEKLKDFLSGKAQEYYRAKAKELGKGDKKKAFSQ